MHLLVVTGFGPVFYALFGSGSIVNQDTKELRASYDKYWVILYTDTTKLKMEKMEKIDWIPYYMKPMVFILDGNAEHIA